MLKNLANSHCKHIITERIFSVTDKSMVTLAMAQEWRERQYHSQSLAGSPVQREKLCSTNVQGNKQMLRRCLHNLLFSLALKDM